MSNESYDLAAEYVVEQINDELNVEAVCIGSTIDVSGLEDCDCIPLDVVDCRHRCWYFVKAKAQQAYPYEITATYRAD